MTFRNKIRALILNRKEDFLAKIILNKLTFFKGFVFVTGSGFLYSMYNKLNKKLDIISNELQNRKDEISLLNNRLDELVESSAKNVVLQNEQQHIVEPSTFTNGLYNVVVEHSNEILLAITGVILIVAFTCVYLNYNSNNLITKIPDINCNSGNISKELPTINKISTSNLNDVNTLECDNAAYQMSDALNKSNDLDFWNLTYIISQTPNDRLKKEIDTISQEETDLIQQKIDNLYHLVNTNWGATEKVVDAVSQASDIFPPF